MNASIALKEWIRRARITQRELSRRLKIDESFLSRLLRGDKTPGLELAAAIEKATGVRAVSWVAHAAESSPLPKARGGAKREQRAPERAASAPKRVAR